MSRRSKKALDEATGVDVLVAGSVARYVEIACE